MKKNANITSKPKNIALKLVRETTNLLLTAEGEGYICEKYELRLTTGHLQQDFESSPYCDMLIQAVNNRTRERNYFQLYSRLLQGELTDEEFEREITDHEDEYVVSTERDVTFPQLQFAAKIAPRLKGVNSMEDIHDLFSIHPKHLNCLIQAN